MQKEKFPCSVPMPNGRACGKTSFYVVGDKGYCERHRQEAVTAAKARSKPGSIPPAWAR